MASLKDLFGMSNSAAGASQQLSLSAGGTQNVKHMQHLLPSGDTIHVSSTGQDSNVIYTTSGQTVSVDDQTLNAILSGQFTIGETLTQEETKEMEDLEKEKQAWIKQQRLKGFQRLPAHLRQAVVDEAYLRDCIRDMNNVDESKFDHEDRLQELKSREKASRFANHLGVHQSQQMNWFTSNTTVGFIQTETPTFKYINIIEQFTTQELAEAHAAATLEESISEDSES